MDEKITRFIQSIAAQLEGLPEAEIRKAVGFYEEYFNEAVEAGQDPEDILKSLETPEKIAAMLRTETSLLKAESNPSLGNFSKMLRNAFRYVTTPFTVFLLSMVVLILGGLVVGLSGGVIGAVLGAIAIAIGLFYEGVRIPGHFLMEIIGTIGIALFGAGICLLLAFYFYKGARLLIQCSTKLIRLITRGYAARISGKSSPEPIQTQKTSRTKPLLAYILWGFTLAGAILVGVSGLPWKYLVIFNGMRSEAAVQKISNQYDPGATGKISVVTAHSKIKITQNSVSKIIITYEQPDWLDYEVKSDGSMLSFHEKTNGRLPLFRLVALHESFTELVVSLPKGYDPELITLESSGGPIEIAGLAVNGRTGARITAQTFNGEIKFDATEFSKNYSLKANTVNGRILANGISAGQNTGEGLEYYRKTRTTRGAGLAIIELKSVNGNINLKID
ncbi:MAG: DUF1700 domain-containing protein [Firmicutes bacterium]|nr:DUF1700 domain-containing protein [Bacillota bacterium]